jgi:hypothetical protein
MGKKRGKYVRFYSPKRTHKNKSKKEVRSGG